MKKTDYFCDACGYVLTDTNEVPRFRLHLTAQRMEHRNLHVCAIAITPPIQRDHHFCDLKCLKSWISLEKDGGKLPVSL